MGSKVNFLRGQRSHTEHIRHVKRAQCVAHTESFCGPKSYYANQDMFCGLKPKPISVSKDNPQKIYTKEL